MIEPDASPKHKKGQPGIVRAALSGLCPQCGTKSLFEAPARIAFECTDCGLDFSKLERGGRLVGLLTITIAALLITAAIWVDVAFRPPLWLQAIAWTIVTVGVVLGTLRLFKVALLYRQYDAQQEKGEK